MDVYPIQGFSDPFSSISHLLGAAVCLVLGYKLIHRARGKASRVLSVCVFIISVVFLLSMSGVYHLLEHHSSGRAILQRLDHAGIFVLIAGTYTPVHTMLFSDFWRWGILFIIWALAITGITLKSIFFNELAEWLGLLFYLALGWIGILSGYLTHRLHGFSIIVPLLLGAIAYTLGASLEFLRAPIVIRGVIGPHELFHIFVLLGIAFHWQFINKVIELYK